MDIATGLGLVAGVVVIVTLILMGGDFRMFYDVHAIIIIFGGSIAATLIRFPLAAMLHGLPLGIRFAFSLRSTGTRELVDELASLAASEFAERLRSKRTGEWMYIFKPEVGGVPVYLKVILRTDCVVISCHVEKEQSREDD